jgi:general secretion pathway protein E
MINIPELEDLDLSPNFPEEVEINTSIKYGVLFAEIPEEMREEDSDNSPIAILDRNKIGEAVNFITKLEHFYPIYHLDEKSYERLYHRSLELKNDADLKASMPTESEDDSLLEDDTINLAEFLQNSSDILTSEESAPIIKFVNALFYQAVKRGASDIHIEVHELKGEVRFRIDGALVKHIEIEKSIINLIISRIKVISNLDISEKRIPQDGRTQIKIAGETVDIRVSVLPSYYGERVVMRILMQSDDIPTLEELGFSEEMTSNFRQLLKYSHGMILITGPTGSGKSTTLHAFLQTIATREKNIMTVEDPVEYKADNVSQIQANAKVGLTFASALRSILRQDPDIVMVGEMRDKETATIGIQAALTGHLLLSTLHTNTATAAVTRLIDIGVDKFLITSTLRGVLAQRLVRKLCTHCKEEDSISELYAEEYGLPEGAEIYKAKGCSKCSFTGYHGRQAVGELFMMDDGAKKLIKDEATDFELRQYMEEKGFMTLADGLKDMLLKHETSLDEVIRVGLKEA